VVSTLEKRSNGGRFSERLSPKSKTKGDTTLTGGAPDVFTGQTSPGFADQPRI